LSRPITGSSLPCLASSVRSIPNCSNALCCSSVAAGAPCIFAMNLLEAFVVVLLKSCFDPCLQRLITKLSRLDSSLPQGDLCGQNFQDSHSKLGAGKIDPDPRSSIRVVMRICRNT